MTKDCKIAFVIGALSGFVGGLGGYLACERLNSPVSVAHASVAETSGASFERIDDTVMTMASNIVELEAKVDTLSKKSERMDKNVQLNIEATRRLNVYFERIENRHERRRAKAVAGE